MSFSKNDETTYTISEVSRMVGLSQKRIRDYEKEGFLKPGREKGTNNRVYTRKEVLVIERVNKLIHRHGFTLACLKNLVVSAPCWVVFDCRYKDACPTYQSPGAVCYLQRSPDEEREGRQCETCPVYLNRRTPRLQIF